MSFPLGRVLDCGCGTGVFLKRVADRSDGRYGVDIDQEKLARAATLNMTCVRLVAAGAPLPFRDGAFDTVVLMEVIEHVADERAVLSEVVRVLAPGGKLLLTTPHRGLLTFLDPGNFKFIAPRVHRFIHRVLLRQGGYYEERFGQARRDKQGMIADFPLDQSAWHRHYSFHQIRALVPAELRTVAQAVYYPAFRALWSLRLALRVLTFGLIRTLPRPASWISNRLSRVRSTLGDQLVALFEKTG